MLDKNQNGMEFAVAIFAEAPIHLFLLNCNFGREGLCSIQVNCCLFSFCYDASNFLCQVDGFVLPASQPARLLKDCDLIR
jgi:hypothetical protein